MYGPGVNETSRVKVVKSKHFWYGGAVTLAHELGHYLVRLRV
jgi:hypothetical protein